MPRDKYYCPGDPLQEVEADGGGQRAIENGNRARRATEQDRLGQRAVNGDFKPLNVRKRRHQRSIPPPKEKKERKNELVAKAIGRPNTI